MSARLIWDSPEWRQVRDKSLFRWLREDSAAVDCVVCLSTISEFWDDLIDKDHTLTEQEIHRGLLAAMIGLQENPFWNRWHHKIMPVVIVGTNAWLDANELEPSQSDTERMLAYYLRNYAYEVATMAVYCAGGWDWLRSVSMEMRRFFQHDSYFDWRNEMRRKQVGEHHA